MFKGKVIPKKKTSDCAQKASWFVKRTWAKNPNTIQTKISKETKRFLYMVIGSLAVNLLGTLPA